MSELRSIKWQNEKIILIDQTLLPHREEWREIELVPELGEAIKTLAVRGAPALGVAGALGLRLVSRNFKGQDPLKLKADLEENAARLNATRPTAVNLAWALKRVMEQVRLAPDRLDAVQKAVWEVSEEILRSEEEYCRQIAAYGSPLIPRGARVITHCNTGALATGGIGTALGVVKTAWEQHRDLFVWVDETRPLLQGARLTAWELEREKIPYKIISDNMAGFVLKQGMADLAIVGADRITRNGDTANKIGTYSLAVLARYHKIPFYVAAPSSTVDLSLKTGEEIPIEERKREEVLGYRDCLWAPREALVYNPAFDVTPGKLISGIITEKGVAYPPYRKNLAALLGSR